MEILPINQLRDIDLPILGSLNIALAKLGEYLPVADGIVVTPPDLHLKTALENYDFGTKEIFEQSLTLVKKEIEKIPVQQELRKEIGKHDRFLVNGQEVKSVKSLWILLLNIWILEIKQRLWKDGFKNSLTEGLEPQIVVFTKKVGAFGNAYFDFLSDDTVINIKFGKLEPNQLKKLHELVVVANKKLIIPHVYEWILDGGIKLIKVLQYTPNPVIASEAWQSPSKIASSQPPRNDERSRSVVKVFFDLSTGLIIEKQVDGIYIQSEKIFDLNMPRDSFENLVFRLVEAANTFPVHPVLFKLADKSEGMGKVRGTLRLLHQKNLLEPLLDAADFARHKKGLTNIHLVIPFVRGVNEFLQIKRELASRNLSHKSSLQIWLEVAVPENIVNLEIYLESGLDGIVLNLDELIAHLNGFDHKEAEMILYKNEVAGLLKFLEDGLKLLHKSRIPFIAQGSLTLYPQVLEFLVEKGIYGMVAERFDAHSAKDLLHLAERRLILRRTS